MKIITTTFVFLIAAIVCTAQQTTNQSLQKFTTLKVYDRISVNLVKGNENKLVVSGEDSEDVSIQENNGQLKIKMDLHEFLSGNTVNIDLYYTETLTLIDANENARIISKNSIKGSFLEVRAQEAGVITLNIQAESVKIKSTSGSEIKLSGTTGTQDASINTGGKLYNKGLTSKNTKVTVLAGGHAEIFATDKAVAKVKAGGSISIYGNPKLVDRDDTFGGSIKLIE